ncbi:MAG: hypothetical protein O3B84_06675 [Chloroflexi bacterium]|nr:hypothetical protein [Chloroflexota bacterium]
MARAQGIPDYPIVILPSPIATLDGGGLDAQADRAIAQVVAILLAHD